jgi:hypothetical protein
MNDEFYIGWQAKAAPGIAKTVRRAAATLLLVALLVPLALAFSQHLIGTGVFEWGTLKSIAGVFVAQPYPHLLVPRPGKAGDQPAFSTYYLVAQWKFGLPPEAVAPFDGKWVTLKGTLIYRGNQTMIETRPDWIQAGENKSVPLLPPGIALGKQTLAGEIVDSKCFLGVMNPGQLAPHRACAIRCISGGIPPVLLVRQTNGTAIYLLLVSASGQPVNQQILDLVDEPVEITGEVERQGELLILRAEPSTYRRLN